MAASNSSRHYTLEDYLGVEEESPVRHELLDGQIYAMAGGTPAHAALGAAVVMLLGEKLRGGPCRVFNADLRIRVVATGLFTYPDAAVVCGPLALDPSSPTHVTNPRLLVEVLSASTEAYDRGEKREHYQQIESLREYVLVAQDRQCVEVFSRDADGVWSVRVACAADTIVLPSLAFETPTSALYAAAGLTLD